MPYTSLMISEAKFKKMKEMNPKLPNTHIIRTLLNNLENGKYDEMLYGKGFKNFALPKDEVESATEKANSLGYNRLSTCINDIMMYEIQRASQNQD